MPALFTKRPIQTNSNQETEEKSQSQAEEPKFQYQNYGTIKLLHKKENTVEEVNLDEYLCHVVSAEMPADYEFEALKAQAIVARTYTIYKIKDKKHEEADICDDSTCCQAWVSKEVRFSRWEEGKRQSNWDKITKAVNDTQGKIVTYQNEPIQAFFHANSGGTTEMPVNVWGGSGFPYLDVVQTAGEDGYQQYASEVILSHEEIINKLKEKYEDIAIDFANEDEIQILEHTDSTRVKTIKFGNHNLSGTEARTIFGLRSTNFEMSKEADKIKFVVKGYGHGVGMSQTGADSMAKQDSNCEEIINHFYKNIEIKDINSL